MRELSDPSGDCFEHGLAALALARQAPGSAPAAIPQLLLTLEGNSTCLQPASRRALLELAPGSGGVLVRCRLEGRYTRPEASDALRAALELAGESAIDELVAALARPDPRAVKWARVQLVRLGRAALPALIGAMGEEHPPLVRVRAIEISRAIDPGGAEVLPPLRATLASPDESVSAAGATAIVRIQLGRAAAADPGDRDGILEEIALLGKRALPALAEELKSPAAERAEAARQALQRIALAILQSEGR